SALLSGADGLYRLHCGARRRAARPRCHLRHARHRLSLQQGRPALPSNLRLPHLRPHHSLFRRHHYPDLADDALPSDPHHRLRPQLRLRAHQHRRLRHPAQRPDRQRQRSLQPHAQCRWIRWHLSRDHAARAPRGRPPERDRRPHSAVRPRLPEQRARFTALPQRPLRARQRRCSRTDQPLRTTPPPGFNLGLRRRLPLALAAELRLHRRRVVLQEGEARPRPCRRSLILPAKQKARHLAGFCLSSCLPTSLYFLVVIPAGDLLLYFEADPYRTVNVASSGSSADDPPAITLYSPLGLVQRFAATSQIDSYVGSTSIVNVLLSPGASSTFLYAISRFHGSSALCGSAAYTSATSAPARAPAFFTVSVTVSPSLPTFRLE